MLLRVCRFSLLSICRAHSTSSNTTHFGFDEVPENEKQTRVNEVFPTASMLGLISATTHFEVGRIRVCSRVSAM